jgi:hypothetical protein
MTTKAVSVLNMAIALTSLIYAADSGSAPGNSEKEKGFPQAPPNAQALAGTYYRGRGLAYNLELALQLNGEYTAKWDSCLYKPGVAAGKWSLSDKQITFTPPMEGEMLRGPIETLTILKFKSEWILVPTDEQSRRFYDQEGVTSFSCFQRTDLAGTWQFDNGLMGEFHTLKLDKRLTFSWFLRDQPLRAEDTYYGTWQVRDGTVCLSFISGQAKSGKPLTPTQRMMVLSIAPDRQSLSSLGDAEAGFRLERTKAKSQ